MLRWLIALPVIFALLMAGFILSIILGGCDSQPIVQGVYVQQAPSLLERGPAGWYAVYPDDDSEQPAGEITTLRCWAASADQGYELVLAGKEGGPGDPGFDGGENCRIVTVNLAQYQPYLPT